MRRIFSGFLALVLGVSLAGCNNTGVSSDQPSEAVSSVATEQPADSLADVKEGIVGVWVVEKHEIYEGPMKDFAEQSTNMAYPIGSEHIFTEDGIFENSALKMSTTYKIINDHQISCVSMVGQTVEDIYDYRLNGDELILYGNYTGDFASYGHCNAMYFKRK